MVGNKRLKIARGVSGYVPTAVNFSQLEKELEEDQVEYQASDDGMEKKRIEDNLQYEEMIVQILNNLEFREKLIFVFQLLRDNGYQIDHGSFAKVVGLSRRQYMRVLEDVRIKSAMLVIGYNRYGQSHKED